MTEDLLKQSNKVKGEIEKIQEIIRSLHYRMINNNDRAPKKNKGKFTLRILQREKEGAKMFVFDEVSMYGTDIEVNAELVEYVKAYFEKKLEEKKLEFEQLGKEE